MSRSQVLPRPGTVPATAPGLDVTAPGLPIPVQQLPATHPSGPVLTAGLPATPAGPALPGPRTGKVRTAEPLAAEPPTAEPPTAEPPTRETPESEPTAGRPLPRLPRRRAPIWLAALVLGAVVAALPGLIGGRGTDGATAADYGLGVASDIGFTGGLDDARQSITEAEAQARLGELAASRAAREPRTVLPTQGHMSTCFCRRWGTMHWGLDLAAPLGTPILAAHDGVVLRAGPATGYGNAVYIQDTDGNVEIYGHMRYYNVHAGETVRAGDQIAKVGSEGQSTGPHLHFEIHVGGMTGRPTDPQVWLADRGIAVP